MVTVRIKGGLGNQLFQYASGYALAKRLGTEMDLDIRFFGEKADRAYRLGLLNVECQTVHKGRYPLLVDALNNKYINAALRKKLRRRKVTLGRTRYLVDCTLFEVNQELFQPAAGDVYLEGYYQTERYFLECRESLLSQFVPVYPPEEAYLAMLEQIRAVNSCAVHVRRGDFVTIQEKSGRGFTLHLNYYKKALEYIAEHMENPTFFWFSDDIEWVRQNMGDAPNYRFVTMNTLHPDIDELMLMKNCRSIITANSTFSWWAAWLHENADALIVAPRRTYANPYIKPDRWIKL